MWIIKRNCSATPAQLASLFASIVALSFIFGVGFAAFGLWMVLPFVGIELLAVAAAFFVYGRHAADVERIELSDDVVRVAQVDGSAKREWRCAALWARIEIEGGAGDADRVHAFLASRGERIEVGRHLPDARRLALAGELKKALRAAAAA